MSLLRRMLVYLGLAEIDEETPPLVTESALRRAVLHVLMPPALGIPVGSVIALAMRLAWWALG